MYMVAVFLCAVFGVLVYGSLSNNQLFRSCCECHTMVVANQDLQKYKSVGIHIRLPLQNGVMINIAQRDKVSVWCNKLTNMLYLCKSHDFSL